MKTTLLKSLRNPGQHDHFFSHLTKADIILFLVALLLSIASLGLNKFARDIGREVIVEVNGTKVAKLDLLQNQRIEVKGPLGTTVIEVKDGKVSVVASACPNKVCVKTGPVNRAGDTIVCVPNRVVVRVLGKNKKRLDVITG